jgi:hypothetical protein
MRARALVWGWLLPLAMAVTPLDAQEPRTDIALYGFSARGGVDFDGRGQAIVSVALDVGHLFTRRLRLRPSGDLGFLGDDNTYVASLELVYRLLDDAHVVVPYLSAGLGVFGRELCGQDPGCPGVWMQFAAGFEVRARGPMSWLVEYHAMDAFDRHRFMIGLTTRRWR